LELAKVTIAVQEQPLLLKELRRLEAKISGSRCCNVVRYFGKNPKKLHIIPSIISSDLLDLIKDIFNGRHTRLSLLVWGYSSAWTGLRCPMDTVPTVVCSEGASSGSVPLLPLRASKFSISLIS
jgi:hypothetical protein